MPLKDIRLIVFLLLLVNFHVISKMVRISETPEAHRAHIRCFAGMSSHVSHDTICLCKALPTYLTRVWFDAEMDPLVDLQ